MFFRNFLRIFRASLRGFVKDQIYLHASSLTFYTLLSTVPLLAVAFGLAKGFGFEQNFETELQKWFSDHHEIVTYVVDFARSLLGQMEESYITGIGVVFLFLFVLSLFWTIEASMNAIWKVKKSRTPLRMLTDYLAMMIICPFLFVIASSMTVYVSSQISTAIEQHQMLQKVTPYLFLLYRAVTLVIVWALFSCIYLIMPNTKVSGKYALASAVIAGTFYYGLQIAMINFQIGVSQYNAIYGSFAALPLFLLWLQISWLLVLLGAEMAYHAEHLSPTLNVSASRIEVSRNLFIIAALHKMVRSFSKGDKPWTVSALSEEYGMPESTIRKSLDPLTHAGILSIVRSDKHEIGYQPAKDIQRITLHSVLHASNPCNTEAFLVNASDDIEIISNKLKDFERDVDGVASNLQIAQL